MTAEEKQRALDQLAEMDKIFCTSAYSSIHQPTPEWTSLLHQKQGLIDYLRRETGLNPYWTGSGYKLRYDPNRKED